MQAQDYGSAKWALAQRTRAATDADVEAEIAEGAILRTHILRPTWHFVAAADIGWMLALSAPRVHAANAYWYRWLEVDDAVARRSRTVLTNALRDGKQLTARSWPVLRGEGFRPALNGSRHRMRASSRMIGSGGARKAGHVALLKSSTAPAYIDEARRA